MKPKILSLWAIFFLSAIFLFLPLLIATGGDWKTFGNTYLPAYHYQSEQFFGNFLTSNITTTSIAHGLSVGQPLIMDLGSPTENYIVMPYGNYLEVWDSNLNFVNDVYAGEEVKGAISGADWDNDGEYNEIVGIWNGSGNVMSVRAYSFNYSDYSITLLNETNFTLTGGLSYYSSTGFRCVGGNCYGVLWEYNSTSLYYNWYSLRINSSSYYATQLFVSYNSPFQYPPSVVDWDNDGILEMVVLSTKNVLIYDANGVVEQLFNATASGGFTESYVDARFIKNDNAVNKWRVVIASDTTYSPPPTFFDSTAVRVYRIEDRTLLWGTGSIAHGSQTGYNPATSTIAVKDYNGDYYEDVWICGWNNENGKCNIFNGLNGNVLWSFQNSSITAMGRLIVARLGTDSIPDFVSGASDTQIVDVGTSRNFNTGGMGSGAICIPADTDLDGVLEIVCSKSSLTKIYETNYSNANAQIISVTFEPSTTISLSETLYMYVLANDTESDYPFYYIWKCDDSESFSAEQTSSTLTCSYSSLGYKNVTIGVRDYYNSEYDYFSQIILVTQTGQTCDNDGNCESGETTENCPNDCPPTPPQNYTEAEGGIALNTQLVNPDNTQQGLLPDIYYGILGFLSLTLSPTITIVFLIISVLVILAIGMIIKAIASKVADLGS